MSLKRNRVRVLCSLAVSALLLAGGTVLKDILRAGEEILYWRLDSVVWMVLTAIFLTASIFMVVLSIALFRQTQPVLGPEAEWMMLIISSHALSQYSYEDVCLYVWYQVYADLFLCALSEFVYCFLLLAALRGIWGWVRSGLSSEWCGSKRIASTVGRQAKKPGAYLLALVLYAFLALILGCISFWYFYKYFDGYLSNRYIVCAFLGIGFILSAVMAFYHMVCGFVMVDHLTAQIERIHNGHVPEIREGFLCGSERQLADLSGQRDKAVQDAVVSERFKVDLIANVSHDLRTPLAAILGYGELMEKEDMPEQALEYLKQLNQKAGYMNDLVESLFELTKVSSGILACSKTALDIIRLLEQTIGLYDEQLQKQRLQIRRHYDADSIMVMTDGSRMHQVFSNLLGNAIKYTLPDTRIHLEVRETEGESVIRMVNIASYEMDFEPEEILQRFARGDKARSTKGSGLGLAIAQTYTESVGGTFQVKVDGEQFCAVVTLPKAEINTAI